MEYVEEYNDKLLDQVYKMKEFKKKNKEFRELRGLVDGDSEAEDLIEDNATEHDDNMYRRGDKYIQMKSLVVAEKRLLLRQKKLVGKPDYLTLREKDECVLRGLFAYFEEMGFIGIPGIYQHVKNDFITAKKNLNKILNDPNLDYVYGKIPIQILMRGTQEILQYEYVDPVERHKKLIEKHRDGYSFHSLYE